MLYIVWTLFNWLPNCRDLVMGVFVSAIVIFLIGDLFQNAPKLSFNPRRCYWIIYYMSVFLWECVKANIDVAYRVVHPRLPIRPGIVKVKTGLVSDEGLTFLANSITLTPGNTVVDIDKDNGYIYIHQLYAGDSTSAPVTVRFEKILKRIFE